jgi:hypothetical protein
MRASAHPKKVLECLVEAKVQGSEEYMAQKCLKGLAQALMFVAKTI